MNIKIIQVLRQDRKASVTERQIYHIENQVKQTKTGGVVSDEERKLQSDRNLKRTSLFWLNISFSRRLLAPKGKGKVSISGTASF